MPSPSSANWSQHPTTCRPRTSSISPRQQAFQARFSTLEAVNHAYSPAQWSYALSHSERALTAHCITLGGLDVLYGQGAAHRWLAEQLTALFLGSTNRDREASGSVTGAARLLASAMAPMKLSELMLFFAGYAVGAYGADDWQSFDPRRIGAAFFREFMPRRNRRVAQLVEEAQARAEAEREARERQSAISYDEYRRLKAEAGGARTTIFSPGRQ